MDHFWIGANLMPNAMMQMFAGGGAAPVKFTIATGGTITTVGDYKIHKFTSNGTFNVTQLGDDAVV